MDPDVWGENVTTDPNQISEDQFENYKLYSVSG